LDCAETERKRQVATLVERRTAGKAIAYLCLLALAGYLAFIGWQFAGWWMMQK
jgi:hypothetical protein